MKEEWRTIVIDGKEHPWYSVSNFGNIRSHLRQEGLGVGRGSRTIFDPNFYNDLLLYSRKKKDGSLSYKKIGLQFPEDFFEEYQYVKKGNTSINRTCSGHELVMGAFRPIDEYPPDRLKDCWNDIPEDAKTWIKQTIIINHIDHDPSNNRVDNLEYVTHRENSRAAVKHYGGNLANKSKQKDDDEFMIFTEPKFNVLFQEWEDVKVELHGDEGEECYNMLVDIGKDRGISPEKAFLEVIREGIEREKHVIYDIGE